MSCLLYNVFFTYLHWFRELDVQKIFICWIESCWGLCGIFLFFPCYVIQLTKEFLDILRILFVFWRRNICKNFQGWKFLALIWGVVRTEWVVWLIRLVCYHLDSVKCLKFWYSTTPYCFELQNIWKIPQYFLKCKLAALVTKNHFGSISEIILCSFGSLNRN